MKKLIFTLMMMAGLAFVTGTAMALNDVQVYANGTYSYKLTDVTVNTAGTVSINYAGDASETVTVTNGFTGAAVTTATNSDADFTATAGTYDAEFNITFSGSASTGTANLRVNIEDGSALGCSNFIDFSIEVLPPPTYKLIVEASTTSLICQTREGAGNNAPNATLATTDEVNTYTFKVTPTFTGLIEDSTFNYNFTMNIAEYTDLVDFDITGPDGSTEINYGTDETWGDYTDTFTSTYTNSGHDFTVTFKTTTGEAAQEIAAALSEAAGDAVLTATGGVTINATFDAFAAQDTLNVGAVPTIGSFGN